MAAILLRLGLGLAGLVAASPPWQAAPPLPKPRGEVAAAVRRGEIVVVAGFTADGESTGTVQAYDPARRRWRSLPDLPVGLNHAMAAAYRGRLYVLGGYGSHGGAPQRGVWTLIETAWKRLPPLPEPRAAAGVTVVGGRLYVVGGVGATGVASRMLVLDLTQMRWSKLPGPTPREHLAVAALHGRIYALGGRVGGYLNSFALFQVYTPGGTWSPLPPVPTVRSGTGAAVVGNSIVSLGGETADGIVSSVYAFDVGTGTWSRLPDLATPRHGLGVVSVGSRVYAVGGGTEPGLSVSAANEYLDLG